MSDRKFIGYWLFFCACVISAAVGGAIIGHSHTEGGDVTGALIVIASIFLAGHAFTRLILDK